jgi:hypothetical protein
MSKKQRDQKINPGVGLVVYRGPSDFKAARGAMETEVAALKFIGTLTATAGGVLATVFDSVSSLSSSPDWASYQNLWQEYRILSYKVEMKPWNKYNQPSTSTLTPVSTVEARDSNTALASVSDAAGYDSVELHAPSTDITRVIKMADTGEAQFIIVVNSPAATDRLYIKLYSSGNTASINLYDYLATVLVQFRGRK